MHSRRPMLIQLLEARTLFSTYTLSDVAAFTHSPSDALVIDTSGNLFGATASGGANNFGSIYEVANGASTVTTLASFAGSSGGLTPVGPIAIDSSGNLFGTTAYGGTSNLGTIFELAHGSSTLTVLASFDSTNGATPGHAGVILDSAGNLYGATSGGGNTGGDGAVYELPHGSSTITLLASFNGGDSADPQGRLVRDASGNLFGTTRSVGANGSVYEVVANSGAVTTLATFNGSNGQYPTGVLATDSAGNLYGTTQLGGANGGGTVFEVPAGTSTLVTLTSFSASFNPIDSGLIVDSTGNVFGATSSNPTTGDGTLFELRSGSSTPVTLATFDGTLGASPTAIISDNAGGLYGVATTGGANSAGALFHLVRTSSGPQSTATALQASASSVVTGEAVTFTAVVSPATAGDETPAGLVDFAAGGVFLGSATLDSNGIATFSTTSLPVGDSTIIASYAGDTDSLNSDSPAVIVTVASSATSPFTDTLAASAGRTAGESLQGAAVESSTSDSWLTTGSSDFTFSTTNANTLNATDAGTDIARVYRTLGSGTYIAAANLWPGTDSSSPWLGVGFLSSGNDPTAGDPLYFRIQTSGAYELDATGTSGTPTVLASGTVNADTWSITNAPRIDLTWNTAGNTAAATINGVAVATNVDLSAVGLDSSAVNSVGFAKQGDSDASLAVSNFTFTSNAATTAALTIGGLDTPFGSAGVSANALGFTSFVASATENTDTLLLGDTAAGFAVARLTPDSAIDPSFGSNGIAASAVDGTTRTAAAITVLPDGSILVAATANGSSFAIERFSADGTAIVNMTLPSFSTGSTDTLHAMTVSNGTIYLAGQTVPTGGAGDFAVEAIDENGSAITTFGPAGQATVDLGGADTAYAAAVQKNGRVVLAGSSGNTVALARLKTDGTLDKSFNRTGFVTTSVRGVSDGATSLAIAKNNAIVVGGYSASGNASSDFLVMRYTAAGKVDRSFGKGPVITSFGQPAAVTQVAIDSQGDIVASGKTVASLTGFSGGDTNLAVARYTTKGLPDAKFNATGKTIVDIGATNSGSTVGNGLSLLDTSPQGSLAIDASGDIHVFGNAGASTTQAVLIGAAADVSAAVTTTKTPTYGGKKIVVSIKLTSLGNLTSVGTATIALSLTTDGQSLGSISLPPATVSVNLKPGKSRVYRETIIVPTGLRGSYFISATVSGITDLNPLNNTALSATAVAVTPTKA